MYIIIYDNINICVYMCPQTHMHVWTDHVHLCRLYNFNYYNKHGKDMHALNAYCFILLTIKLIEKVPITVCLLMHYYKFYILYAIND